LFGSPVSASRSSSESGRDVERLVLARAVEWHLVDRVLLHEHRKIVF